MKIPIIDPALVSALKKLKLGHIVDALPERTARRQTGHARAGAALLVLSDEITRRETTSTERRAKDAGLDLWGANPHLRIRQHADHTRPPLVVGVVELRLGMGCIP